MHFWFAVLCIFRVTRSTKHLEKNNGSCPWGTAGDARGQRLLESTRYGRRTVRAVTPWLESRAPVGTLPRRTRKDPTVSSNIRSLKLSEINYGSKNTIGRVRVVCEAFKLLFQPSRFEFSLFKTIHLYLMS